MFSYLDSHSPFRQHKTKDKHEIDRMTLTVVRRLQREFPVSHKYADKVPQGWRDGPVDKEVAS